ncbi:MAG: hypothetical protein SNJ71_06210 [Bacteroidales bacterium]
MASFYVLSMVKFAIVAPLGILTYKFNIYEAIFIHIAGGGSGVIIFSLLSNQILKIWNRFILFYNRLIKRKPSKKKIFSKRTRLWIHLKNRYGLIGIAIITPILSIPVGAFIAVRFYPIKTAVTYLFISIVFWSLILNILLISGIKL